MGQRNYSSRIGRKVIVLVILFSTLITLATTTLQLYREYRRDTSGVHEQFDQVKRSYLRGVTSALRQQDNKQLQDLLDGVIALPDVAYVAVRTNGEVIAQSGGVPKSNSVEETYPLEYVRDREKQRIADLRVVATLSGVYQRLYDRIWIVLISNAITIFLVALFIMIIIAYLITRRLQKIAEIACGLSSDRLDDFLELDRTAQGPGANDEIDDLALALKQMYQSLKQAYEGSQKSEAQFRDLIEGSIQGILIHQVWRPVFANQAVSRIFGFNQPEEILAIDSLQPYIAPADQERLRGYIEAQRFEDDAPVHFEFDAFRKDGSSIRVENVVRAVEWEGQKAVQSTLLDISERNRAEQDLRRSQTSLAEAQRIAHVGNWEWYLDTNEVDWTDEIFRIFGQDPDAFAPTAESFAEHLHPEDRQRIPTTAEAILKNKVFEPLEFRILRPDRSLRYVHVEGEIRTNVSGKAVSLYGTLQDITQTKQVEQALHEARDRLEDRVEERTRELAHAQQKAEDASRFKSEFLANMSHEIRTPMNAILGICHLALRTQLNPKQQDYLDKIHDSAHTLLGIIDDILDFSKIEAGKLVLESIDFRLEQVFESLSTLTEIKAQEKGLELLFELQEGVPQRLLGDPLRLGQVLTNLTQNAIKFTDRGEILVSVALEQAMEENIQLRFTVQDTGIGIAPDKLSVLFQSFTQADGSTTRKYGGTGLGLAICRQLVEMMGGEIGARSVPGEGSTFFFTAVFGRSRKADGFPQTPISELVGRRLPPRAPTSDAEDTGLPEALPGVDLALGLKRVGGNRRLFRKLLLEFRRDHADAVQKFASVLGEGNLAGARRLVHTLKGVSGNIGAESLHTATQELEEQLEQGGTRMPDEVMQRFEAAAQQVFDALEALASESLAPRPESREV